MTNKQKTRDAEADSIKSLKERRELYVQAGKDTSAIDARLASFGVEPAAKPEPKGDNTPTNEAKGGSDQPAAPQTPPGGDGVENKALTPDDEENAKAKAQLENKAQPTAPSQPSPQASKPAAPRSGAQGGRSKA
ncbi:MULTISPECIES: hypothetical protein [Mycolicibacterium]|uniref:hypothetical protein n=1 Tax=Mycolicibacterium TaxID=1866885 RepID=UPI001CDB6715|nr:MULTISPECIES: hypothetical protein [Mycolicibacterium]MCC9181083.1 hypothetical protein [Mycolicibacterium mageritense]UBV14801.1 hypothetical protein H8Z57_29580 [Mycolicibacterium fortuitum]